MRKRKRTVIPARNCILYHCSRYKGNGECEKHGTVTEEIRQFCFDLGHANFRYGRQYNIGGNGKVLPHLPCE